MEIKHEDKPAQKPEDKKPSVEDRLARIERTLFPEGHPAGHVHVDPSDKKKD